ncbi:MAG: SAM-dependent chlorinase/fluorinase, partial [Acidobacteriota bacterium]|nr:SAM-dependent chlorinase/fluorinase [Acidobacteriota bacterium]
TNITRKDVPDTAAAKLRIKGTLVKSFRNYFAEETASRDKIFGVWGSAGFLELAAKNDSAARLLNVSRDEAVVVKLR